MMSPNPISELGILHEDIKIYLRINLLKRILRQEWFYTG